MSDRAPMYFPGERKVRRLLGQEAVDAVVAGFAAWGWHLPQGDSLMPEPTGLFAFCPLCQQYWAMNAVIPAVVLQDVLFDPVRYAEEKFLFQWPCPHEKRKVETTGRPGHKTEEGNDAPGD